MGPLLNQTKLEVQFHDEILVLDERYFYFACLFSQFIVVSLKDGMFNNANVLFKTKFVDGVSTVTRYVQNQAPLTRPPPMGSEQTGGNRDKGKGKGKGKSSKRARTDANPLSLCKSD